MKPDYGASISDDTPGVRRRWGGALAVDIAAVPDPANPAQVIMRASRRDGCRTILARGLKAMRDWPEDDRRRFAVAERYRDDAALAAGARPGGDMTGIRASGPRTYIADVVVDAVTRLRLVDAGLRRHDKPVITLIVLGYMGAREFETRYSMRHGRAYEVLTEALDRLGGAYDRQ
jgi:hypothetical protein